MSMPREKRVIQKEEKSNSKRGHHAFGDLHSTKKRIKKKNC